MIYAVKHVVTARKGTTLIIFDRGRRQQVQAAGEDGEDEDEDEDEDVAPAAAEPKPKGKPKPKPSAKPPQPASRPPPPALAGGARPTPAATPPAKQQGDDPGRLRETETRLVRRRRLKNESQETANGAQEEMRRLLISLPQGKSKSAKDKGIL